MNPDPDLVAFVHGELEADAARELRARLADDPDLRAQHAALEAADAALREALDALAAPRARVWPWRPLLAVAALLVVALVFVLPRDDAAAAHNDVVGLSVQVRGGAQQPVFTDAALQFAWTNRLAAASGRQLAVVPFHLGDDAEALGRTRAARAPADGAPVPVVVTAMLHAPDGQRLAARLAADELPVATTAEVQVPLRAFEVGTSAPPPYLGGRPGDREWIGDFRWADENMPNEGPRRFLLDQVGEWTIEVHVESVPPPEAGLWPTFAEPLVVATKVIATGLVSDWGAAVDGMQARLVLATGCKDLEHAPLAIQLRNTSGRTRHYNVVGTTIAKIPQPFHFQLELHTGDTVQTLSVDAKRDHVGVWIASEDLMVEHATGTVRSLVVCADYWRHGRAPLAEQPAGTTLVAVFHFQPSVWSASDPALWRGRLTTGPLRLPERDVTTNR